ncbi:MAG: response regulator, partial [Candidatus Caldatribacteriota bacterium]|nr:response regulator [Candidatus Caldatribacteriota bacterium]
AYTYIPETGWGFVAKQDLSEIYAPISAMLNNLIFLFVAIAIILFFVSLLLSNSLTKPLTEMASVSQKIRSGDFSARNKIHTKDEIGYLADSYNKMADSMESKIKIESGRSEVSDIMFPLQKMKDIDNDAINRFMKITESDMYTLYLLNEEKSEYELLFSVGIDATLVKSFNAHYREGEFAKAIIEKKISHLKDIPPDTVFKFKTIAGTAIPKEIITIPVIVENQVVGVISLASLKKYPLETLEILNGSSYTINMLFSNLLANEKRARLIEEVREKNVKLRSQTEELQSQSEELQSQTDELSEQNTELEMQKKQVEEADQLKSEFLSNMSHELRTPLNSIMALSRVLITQIKDKVSSEEANYLEIIERNGKNLLALINDILDLSKIEAGKLDINLHNFSLIPIIENIRDNLLPIAKEKGIEVSANIPENLPEVQSDSEKIHQVLQNIIGNAVKFTEKGSVSINAEANENQVVIKVIDTGVGIKKEKLPHIFEEFRQVDGSTSRRFEGTGLGLAIANKMADKLGMKIRVKSELGKGSIFTINLPVKWAGSLESEETVILSESWNLDQKEKVAKEPLSGKIKGIKKIKIKKAPKILMVEDNKDTIIQVKMVLEKEGYIVDFAEGGKAALDYVKHTIPDGIILDLMMPEIDGFEVLENIRSTSRTAKIPVLILTAKDLTREDFKKLGANNIQQLLFKGAVNKDELIFKTKSMIGNESKDFKKVKEIEKKEIKKDKKSALPRVKVFPKREGLPTILIAEDNPDNMITVEAILKDKYNLIEAVDGEAALDKIKSNLPELVLMDIALPKMDGLKVVKFLKDEKTTKDIPVIALTAKVMKGDREKIIAAGCNDYIPKPIDPEKMLRKINKWIK